MSRFEKLSHVILHCQYHIVWGPKYRYRVLQGRVAYEVGKSVRVHSERLECALVELRIQIDHVHLLVKVPPKVSISELLGRVKGRAAIQIFRQFPYLKEKTFWGNPFCAKGYFVDTVGVDADDTQVFEISGTKREKSRARYLTGDD